ncbi:MAG: putative N-acetylmannosamine-6-phosphate 2-epimerase [Acetobacteraceae bacterium]
MRSRAALLARLHHALIASCQPVPGGPTDKTEFVVGYALAAEAGGAAALRIESARYVAAVAGACDLSIIGIVKRDLADSAVRITPFVEDVDALAAAGASVIAFDATVRPRPVPVTTLVDAVHARGLLAMADIATFIEAEQAAAAGADIIGSTLSGYTGAGAPPPHPDLELVARAAKLGRPVIAEGRYNAPGLAAAAIRAGASAVCVGTAITRPEVVTRWFADAVAAASAAPTPVLGIDIGGTKTLAVLVAGSAVLDRRQVPTHFEAGAASWIGAIARALADWSGRYAAVAAAVSGVVRDGEWFAANPATLPVPAGFALTATLRAVFQVPALAVNDAQAAAWGEYRFGAGRGRDMIFLTISSGIGGGIVTGGRLLAGHGGLAGSLGQIPLPGATEPVVRLEDAASGFGIAAAAHKAGFDADARRVFAAAQDGAAWAEAILVRAVGHLATALGGMQALIDPELVIIGGGVGLAPGFLERLQEACERLPALLRPRLAGAALGAEAGVLGAADLAQLLSA